MKLAVLYDSKSGNTKQAAEWIAAGMNEHLAKPADSEMLYSALRRWIGAERHGEEGGVQA